MDNRKLSRVATEDEVAFAIDDVVRHGRMTNLSVEGCRIAWPGADEVMGAPVEVTLLQGVVVSGTVVWRDADAIGVTFAKTLPEATVRYFRLSDWVQPQQVIPTDSFGRPLPPLPPTGSRRGSR